MIYNNFRLRSEDDGTNGGGVNEPIGNTNEEEQKPMTFDDMLASNPDFQKEFDRRTTKGINTAVNKERARLEALHSAELTEAQKLAKMTEEEKNEYKAQQREAEIQKREAAITKRELMAEAKEKLADKGLPLSLAEIIDYSDAESAKNSIDAIEKAFNISVAKTVEDKLKGGTPPKDAGSVGEKSKEKAKETEVFSAFGLKK